MDGTADVAAADLAGLSGMVCTVRVVRGPRGEARNLVIAGGEVDFVGSSLSDVMHDTAAVLLDRLTDARGGAVELRASGSSPENRLLLTARPGPEEDIWTVGVEALPAADARLRELNHRVLNSLALLSSIIGIESRALGEGAGSAALERVRSRLVAVSNLYRVLGAHGAGTVLRADVYLRSVADAVVASVGVGERIAVEVDALPAALTTSQAAALGLITNEAMTNAYKHAFGGRSGGRILVSLSESGERLELSVSDNGCGIPGRAQGGLGTTLVDSFAADLSGEMSVRSGEWGTSLRVRFPRAL